MEEGWGLEKGGKLVELGGQEVIEVCRGRANGRKG